MTSHPASGSSDRNAGRAEKRRESLKLWFRLLLVLLVIAGGAVVAILLGEG